MKSRLLKLLLAASLALLPISLPVEQANAAATTQTTHAFLCKPAPAVGTNGGGRVVNTSSTAATQPSYVLNSDGCALIAAADIGFFLSQGYFYGPSTFVLTQTGITASTTSTTSTTRADGWSRSSAARWGTSPPTSVPPSSTHWAPRSPPATACCSAPTSSRTGTASSPPTTTPPG